MSHVPTRGWTRRVAEWSVLVGVVLLMISLFSYQFRAVQGQAEMAAVKSTLGALRVAFVIHQVQASSYQAGRGQTDVSGQRNPFELLQSHPPNYFGEVPTMEGSQAPPGSWFFNAQCDCVVYQPADERWFFSPSGDTIALFKITGSGGGPLQLVAKEVYLWSGEVLD